MTESGRVGCAETGFRASTVSALPGFDPAREEEFCRELLAKQYEEGGREGPYPSYADLARRGAGDFTLCSIKAIKAALRHGYAIAMEARQGGDGETRLHPKDEGAGRQASPNPSPESEA